jgi:hypothetical protein
VFWIAAVAGLAAGCSEAEGPGDCSGDVELEVGEGSTPIFTWSPVCEVAALVVQSPAEAVWSIHSGVGRNALVPPVRYGELPPGGIEEIPAQPLQPGFGYFVRVFRLKREGDQLVFLDAGETVFRH